MPGDPVIWELYQKNPIVDVRLFGHFNFTTSSMMMFVVGGMSFATTVLVPQFLQGNMGCMAESAGMVLSAAGFVLLGRCLLSACWRAAFRAAI